jgi:hypothetical protein
MVRPLASALDLSAYAIVPVAMPPARAPYNLRRSLGTRRGRARRGQARATRSSASRPTTTESARACGSVRPCRPLDHRGHHALLCSRVTQLRPFSPCGTIRRCTPALHARKKPSRGRLFLGTGIWISRECERLRGSTVRRSIPGHRSTHTDTWSRTDPSQRERCGVRHRLGALRRP